MERISYPEKLYGFGLCWNTAKGYFDLYFWRTAYRFRWKPAPTLEVGRAVKHTPTTEKGTCPCVHCGKTHTIGGECPPAPAEKEEA